MTLSKTEEIKDILERMNKFVDDPDSEYYHINKKKRHFWHSRSETISCNVRVRNNFNKAPNLAMNIRAFLINEEKYFSKLVQAVEKLIDKKDQKILEKSIPSVPIGGIPPAQAKALLGLDITISCRLLGYEKELFYLKCYSLGYRPVYMMRILYHTRYSHLKLKKILELPAMLKKGIGFELYLDKIKFF